MKRWWSVWSSCGVALLLTACGGGGSGGDAGTTPPVEPATGLPTPVAGTTTLVRLLSASGDPVGQGAGYTYSLASAGITVEVQGAGVHVVVQGDEAWEAWFVPSAGTGRLAPVVLNNLPLSPFGSGSPSMDWRGGIKACSTGVATVSIDSVRYADNVLQDIDLRFEQRCSGAAGSLRGQVRWVADDPTLPPGPASAPAGLWQPASGSVPATGNFLYFEPTGAEPIVGVRKALTEDNAVFQVDAAGASIDIIAAADRRYFGVLRMMRGVSRTAPGYYEFRRGYPDLNPARGGMAWYRGTANCGSLQGWFLVEDIAFDRGRLTRLALRFEQRCEGDAKVLRGALRWAAAAVRLPPGPAVAPAGLWRAPVGSTPANGNYLFLQSEAGDFVGGGVNQLATPATDRFQVFDQSGRLMVSVTAASGQSWSGHFSSMFTAGRLQAGYFGLFTTPEFNPALGGMEWGGYARGCELGQGWFVVDRVSHADGVLRGLDLRFEQRCSNATGALHGQLRWDSSDASTLARPEDPPPAAAVMALEPVLPAQGNAVYLRSSGRDFIGAGQSYLYTPLNASLVVEAALRRGSTLLSVLGVQDYWTGTLVTPLAWNGIKTGRYAFVGPSSDAPASNLDPLRFEWSGNARGCDAVNGWVDILRVEYRGGVLSALDLDFEQACDASPYPLLGSLRWSDTDTRLPAGPVSPTPATLWAPAAGITPDSGSFIYLKGAPGEFVSEGKTWLLAPPASAWLVQPLAKGYTFRHLSPESPSLSFEPMRGQQQIQVGYYPDVTRSLFTARPGGSLDVGLLSHGCNAVAGWVAVDEVRYSQGELTLLDLRFQQLCEGEGPPLYGRLRWQR